MNYLTRIVNKLNKDLYPERLFFGPEYIILGVNNVCNLHCKMCDVGTGSTTTNFSKNLIGTKPINMPPQLFKTIVDQLKKYYPNCKLGYAFTEPLAYPYLAETLNYARENNIYTSLTTNGLNLAQNVDTLIEGKVSELFLSLDGLPETHNFIRGNPGSFQKAIAGLEKLFANKVAPSVSIFFVITQWNFTELVNFAEFFCDYPIQHLGFLQQNFVTADMANTHNELYGAHYPATASNIEITDFREIDIARLWSEIINIHDRTFPFSVGFYPVLNGEKELRAYFESPEKPIGHCCNDLFSNLMVKSDGSVIPAHGRCYNVTMGNIYQQSLPEIWNSKTYGSFRKDLLKGGGLLPACTRCCSAF